MNLKRKIAFIAAVGVVALSAGSNPVHAGTTIVGGGSTFMSNMTDICASGYNNNKLSNTNTDVISYTGVGSGSGKKGFSLVANAGKAPDFNLYKFAGSESAYSSSEAPTGFVYVPLIGGPIGIAYNLATVKEPISLSSTTLAKIFAGTITKWNDAAIVADNTATSVVTPAVTAPGVSQVTKSGTTAKIVRGATTSTITITATKAAVRAGLKKSLVVTRLIGTNIKVVKTLKMSAIGSVVVPNAVGASYGVSLGGKTIGNLTPDVVTPAVTTVTGKTITMPSTAITVTYRSSTSGTTNMFINYLNKVEPAIWTKATNDTWATAFPTTVPTDGTFQGATGNDGVTNYVATKDGAITYAEVSFITERELYAAKIKNASGIYVAPTVAASADGLANAEIDATGLVTQDYVTKTATAYPINAVAYGIAATAASTNNTAVKGFFSYYLSRCAPASAGAAGYTALTGAFLAKSLAQVAKISAS
ncbi:MAG: substrate-binding domain-containing protein [Ilumatobacteraceae bacterium]|nr:substrate-binding domain-containing protein [Ilumatobacteraceae bacterium]